MLLRPQFLSQMNNIERIIVNESWINREDTYNIRIGGEGNEKGKKLSDEHKRNIGKAQQGISRGKGKKLSDDHKKKISLANKGKIKSDEHCSRISEGCKKKSYKPSSELMRMIGSMRKDRKHSEESKQNISKALIGHKLTEETKNKIRMSNLTVPELGRALTGTEKNAIIKLRRKLGREPSASEKFERISTIKSRRKK